MSRQSSKRNKKEILTTFVLPVFYCRFPEYMKDNIALRLFMMMLRYDNSFGLIGGKVDADESIIEGLKRESMEEAFLDLSTAEDQLKLIGIFTEDTANTKIVSHIYSINFGIIDHEELKKILARSSLSDSSISEGVITICHAYGKHYKSLRANCNLAIGVAKELDIISKEYPEHIKL